MHRIPVSSSNLASVGYDEGSQILEIEFIDGSVYQYFNVPVRVFDGFMSAASHGKYFHRNIRQAGYRYRLVR
jgi:hypothetical protein